MKQITIYLAGDSTVQNCTPEYYPQAGWGRLIHKYFKEDVKVDNHAMGGRSAKSFIREERLDKIFKLIKEGDYLFIQFGHNDEKLEGGYADPRGSYKAYLKYYIDGARQRGATPVLLTPVNRRRFNLNGVFYPTHGAYPEAVFELGKELDVPVIDLCGLSKEYYIELGEEKSKELFLFLEKGESPNYPEGSSDNTHFNQYGGFKLAGLVVEAIKKQGILPSEYFREASEVKFE